MLLLKKYSLKLCNIFHSFFFLERDVCLNSEMDWGLYILQELGDVHFNLLSLEDCVCARKIKSRGWFLTVGCRMAIDESIVAYKCSFHFSLLIFFYLPFPPPLFFSLILQILIEYLLRARNRAGC